MEDMFNQKAFLKWKGGDEMIPEMPVNIDGLNLENRFCGKWKKRGKFDRTRKKGR